MLLVLFQNSRYSSRTIHTQKLWITEVHPFNWLNTKPKIKDEYIESKINDLQRVCENYGLLYLLYRFNANVEYSLSWLLTLNNYYFVNLKNPWSSLIIKFQNQSIEKYHNFSWTPSIYSIWSNLWNNQADRETQNVQLRN